MMKTVKEIVKRERQKRRRRVGIMIVLIALCATAIFFGTKAYHNYKEEECERKRNQSNSKKHNAQTDRYLYTKLSKRNGWSVESIKERQKLYFQ